MPSKSSIFLLALAAVAPYLYDRYQVLSAVVANRPGHFQDVYAFRDHDIKFRDRIRNCEDVVLDEERGLAFLSCDPGRDLWNTVMGSMIQPQSSRGEKAGIYVYDYSSLNPSSASALRALTFRNFDTQGFHPLGIEWDPSTMMLYVVNHAASGSAIEIFHVDPEQAVATHFQTFEHPLLHAPNSIHSIRNGRLYVTNDHYFHARQYPVLSKIESVLGLRLGTVVFVDVNVQGYGPESAKVVARVPFANGVAMLNATTLAVASSSKSGVYFYAVNQTDHTLTSKGYVRTPAFVDNLSVASDGKLLMAGHPFAPALAALATSRSKCVPGSAKDEEKKACECTAPSWVAEWSQEGGLKELYKAWEGEGEGKGKFCSSSMAVRDAKRGVGMVGGLYDRGVMVFRNA